MPDITIERDLTQAAQDIVHALQSVHSGQDVFDALCEAPTENLLDMLEMIAHILKHRGEN